MASELKPLAHGWCEGFICPLRVVGRERGVLRPDLRYPQAESLTASKDMGRCLGWPGWVVVPSALRDQAMPVPVFSAHAHPVSPKGTSTAENLSHSSELCTSLDLLPLPSAFGRALAPTAECRRTEAFLHPQATNQQTSQPAPRRQQQQLP